MAKKQTSSNKKEINITPLGDRVLIKPLSADDLVKKSEFGIIIPETVDKEKPEQGKVVALGEGHYEDGRLIPIKLKVGDRVLFSRYGYDEVKVDGEEYYILKEDNVLAVIK